MKLYDECLPCLLRQVVEATKISTQDREEQQKILDESLKILIQYRNYQNSPELCRDIHRKMKQISGCRDPYHKIKAHDTMLAYRLSDRVEAFISDIDVTEVKTNNTTVNRKASLETDLPMEIAENVPEGTDCKASLEPDLPMEIAENVMTCKVSAKVGLDIKTVNAKSASTSAEMSLQPVIFGTTSKDEYVSSKDNKIDQILSQIQLNRSQLYRVIKSAAVGNVLDSAISLEHTISDRLDSELRQPFAICDLNLFLDKLTTAKSLLVIGDNAGETVFDAIMLKYLSKFNLQITYAVRHAPIINDATSDDALAAGLDQYASIISTGSDVPGIRLEECNEIFQEIFTSADVIISKGQGNYETLSDGKRNIFYLLKAKCPVVARLLSVHQGDFVFKHIGA